MGIRCRNKPNSENVWYNQLSAKFGEGFEVEQKGVLLRWQDIISRISTLKENGLVNGTEAGIVDDFLEFVWNEFPELNSYDKFGLCKENSYLLERRCKSIMEESKLGQVDYHRGWHYYIEIPNKPGVKEIALFPDSQ